MRVGGDANVVRVVGERVHVEQQVDVEVNARVGGEADRDQGEVRDGG